MDGRLTRFIFMLRAPCAYVYSSIHSFCLSIQLHTHQEEFFRVMRKRGNAPLDDIDSDDDF